MRFTTISLYFLFAEFRTYSTDSRFLKFCFLFAIDHSDFIIKDRWSHFKAFQSRFSNEDFIIIGVRSDSIDRLFHLKILHSIFINF